MSPQHIHNLHVFPAQPSDGFENRQVGLARPILFQTLSSRYANLGSDAACKCVDESSLADTRFSRNKNDVTFSCQGLLDPASQSRQCFVATRRTRLAEPSTPSQRTGKRMIASCFPGSFVAVCTLALIGPMKR